ncbi:MAG: hypothetical protein ACP5OZ_02335 [Candidatus Woesearchaeota archaeon]
MLRRKISFDQRFRIISFLLNKLLWFGFIIMGVGIYKLFEKSELAGYYLVLVGGLTLVLFWIIFFSIYRF